MGRFDKDRIRDAFGCQFLLYIHGYFYFSSKSSFLLLGHFEKCDNFSLENVSSCILLFGIWSFKDRLTMPAHHEIADQRIKTDIEMSKEEKIRPYDGLLSCPKSQVLAFSVVYH